MCASFVGIERHHPFRVANLLDTYRLASAALGLGPDRYRLNVGVYAPFDAVALAAFEAGWRIACTVQGLREPASYCCSTDASRSGEEVGVLDVARCESGLQVLTARSLPIRFQARSASPWGTVSVAEGVGFARTGGRSPNPRGRIDPERQ